MSTFQLAAVDRQWRAVERFEHWAGEKLGVDLFAGDTTRSVRQHTLRKLLIQRGIVDHEAGVTKAGASITWAGIFERWYGVALDGDGAARALSARSGGNGGTDGCEAQDGDDPFAT